MSPKKIPIKMCMQLLTFTMRVRHNTSNGSSYPYKNEVVENITNRVINYTRYDEISTGEVKKDDYE
jgi:hypothetical protein